MPKRWNIIKYWKLLLLYVIISFRQFYGHDHTILINEYQQNFDEIMMNFVISLVFIFLTRLRFSSRLSIPEVLKKRYSDRALKLVRKFEKIDIMHKKALLDIQFLKICEDHNVMPKFLRFKVVNSNSRSSSTYRCYQRNVLRKEIYNKRLAVSKLDKKSQSLFNNVKPHWNLIDFHHVLNISGCF